MKSQENPADRSAAANSGREANPNPKQKRSYPRLLLFAVIGAGLVMAVLGYRHFWLSRPIGSGPAGPGVARDAFVTPWTTRPVLLVGLGDSVTAGFGARKGYSYFDRLVANPVDDWPDLKGLCLTAVLPGLRVTNLAVSGSTSTEHNEKQLPRLPPAGSNTLGLVVLTTGGNDLIHNYGRTPPREGAMFGATWDQAQPWIANFERRLETMFAQINAHFPSGCEVFLADIYDPTDGLGDAHRAGLPAWPDGLRIHAAYNETLHRCAARHPNVHLVRIHAAFLGHGIHCTQFWRAHYRTDDPHY